MAAVEVDGLTVRYGDVVAVDGVSLRGAGRADHRGAGAERRRQDHHRSRCSRGSGAPTAAGPSVLGLDPQRRPRRPHPPDGRDAAGRRRRARACGCSRRCATPPRSTTTPSTRPTSSSASGSPARSGARWRQISGGEQRRLALALALVGRPAGRVPRRARLRRRPAGPPGHPRGRGRPARRRRHRACSPPTTSTRPRSSPTTS